MPTSSRGKITDRRRRGLTLIETLIAVSLVALLSGIAYPSVTAGLDTLRLRSAADSIASLLTAAVERAERRQQPVEITIARDQNLILVRGADPRLERRLEIPAGVRIAAVLPVPPTGDPPQRQFLLHPSGTVPRIGIVLASGRGSRRLVRIDPVVGVPEITIPGPEAGL
jgi:prepilin-type N-terminal cleavage/methylation domain-containing protein